MFSLGDRARRGLSLISLPEVGVPLSGVVRPGHPYVPIPRGIAIQTRLSHGVGRRHFAHHVASQLANRIDWLLDRLGDRVLTDATKHEGDARFRVPRRDLLFSVPASYNDRRPPRELGGATRQRTRLGTDCSDRGNDGLGGCGDWPPLARRTARPTVFVADQIFTSGRRYPLALCWVSGFLLQPF